MQTHLKAQRFLIDDQGKFGQDGTPGTMGDNQKLRMGWFNNSRGVDFEVRFSALAENRMNNKAPFFPPLRCHWLVTFYV